MLLLVLLPIGAWWLLRRTVAGYEMRMTGLNAAVQRVRRRRLAPHAPARDAPVGAVCGLAGAIVVLGVHHRYIDGSITAPGYAWTGFTAALLAGGDPHRHARRRDVPGGPPDAARRAWNGNTDIPLQVVDVVQACIILMIAIRLTLGRWIGRRLGAG